MVSNFKIPAHNYTLRERSVTDILKKNSNLNIKSFLNVGFHGWDDSRAHWWIKICEENNIDWKILEIFKENVKNTIAEGCPKDKIILGSILDFDKYDNFDCMMFWHGPEHIEKNIFIEALPKIENKVNKLIIFGMPLGYEPQDIVYDNIYEKHLSEWYPEDWENLGYNVIEVNDRIEYQHITTYKILNYE